MPGLACLNHPSTGVKSKSSPACARDCTTAARVRWRKAESVSERKATVQGAAPAAASVATGGHQNVRGWQHSDKWWGFFSPLWYGSTEAAVPRSGSGSSVGFGAASQGCLWLHPQFLYNICNISAPEFLLFLGKKPIRSWICCVLDFSLSNNHQKKMDVKSWEETLIKPCRNIPADVMF